ncbi:putative uncharacterized protein DDB_G0277003 isoform X1 [Dendrobium catenatum]|uniref:putative uncharacterized protein DDB_G0277003 isoform X1 n=1 Tax=Dendrobium catenatum TaxID=906689 RepID=UPI0009F598EC|nr:putative uncharacterized protein DDB_G0277003 isoform X1 [Dendrobium catenatum]
MALVQDTKSHNFLCLKAAFLALEPANCFISLARQTCGGSLTEEVQNFILELCVENSVHSDILFNSTYVKNILKKVIVTAESTCEVVVEGLYERFAKISALQEYVMRGEENKIFKKISYLFPFGTSDQSCLTNLVVSLHCSLNLLEGDTGCALWPSSLFLSEFILSYPKLFSEKVCFEVGSGVGLVGVALAHVGASKVILTDGDRSSLGNMQHNLELNHLTSDKVHIQYLPWEYATEIELSKYKHDCVLGADIIYDPKCVPHLIRVLCMLLKSKRDFMFAEETEASVAYIATVIRNKETFNYFIGAAEEAHLSIVDITEIQQPLNLLPYMLSYDRASVRLCKISYLF